MREKKEKLQEQEEPFDLKKEIFEWVKIIIAAAAIPPVPWKRRS